MTQTIAPERTASVGSVSAAPTKIRPAVAWAGIGVVSLVFGGYSMGKWFLGDNFATIDPGATDVPTYTLVAARILEWGGLVALGTFVYLYLIRPWRQNGRITSDGLMVMAMATLFWQDPLLDFVHVYFSYSSVFVNFGSWISDVPGALAPNGHLMPEPILWIWPVYVWGIMTPVVIANRLMHKAMARWPGMSSARIVTGTILGFWVFDLVAESIMLRLGLYHLGGAPGPTLYSGIHKFPLIEMVLWGTGWSLFAIFRFYRDDNGRFLPERGASDLRTSPRGRTLVRFLAITGFLQLMMFISYTIPAAWAGFYAKDWPGEVKETSYLGNGICDGDTGYACGGTVFPLDRPGAARLTPDGKLIVPNGAKFKAPVYPKE